MQACFSTQEIYFTSRKRIGSNEQTLNRNKNKNKISIFFHWYVIFFFTTRIIQMIDQLLQSIRYTAFRLIINICIKNRYCYELLSIYCCSMHITGSSSIYPLHMSTRIHHHLLCLMLNVHVNVSWNMKGWSKNTLIRLTFNLNSSISLNLFEL